MAVNKLELINNMEVIESSACGGELEYIFVEDTKENREKLISIGVHENEIDDFVSDDCIDIVKFVSDCVREWKWFNGDSFGGFLDYVPDDAPEWAK